MDQEFNLLGILRILGKWKKYILLATFITFIVSAGVSLLMPNYYRSFAILYAANPELAQPEPINGKEKLVKGLYGSDDDVDRLLSIVNSNQLKRGLISEFDLASHYDIDVSTGKGQERLSLKLDKLYNITKTQFGAISISVEDTDPVYAMNMVAYARQKLNELAKAVILESQNNQIKSKKDFVTSQKDALLSQNAKIKAAKTKYQLYDIESQSASLSEIQNQTNTQLDIELAKLSFFKSISISNDSIKKSSVKVTALKKRKANIEKSIKLLSEGAIEVVQLEDEFKTMNEELVIEKEKLKKLISSEVKNYQPTILIEKEELAVVKSRPKRSIIVLGLGLLAFVLSSLVAIFIESTSSIDWKEIYAGK